MTMRNALIVAVGIVWVVAMLNVLGQALMTAHTLGHLTHYAGPFKSCWLCRRLVKGVVERAIDEGRNVRPGATDDEAAEIEAAAMVVIDRRTLGGTRGTRPPPPPPSDRG